MVERERERIDTLDDRWKEEIYYEELAYVIMEAAKSQLRAADPGYSSLRVQGPESQES